MRKKLLNLLNSFPVQLLLLHVRSNLLLLLLWLFIILIMSGRLGSRLGFQYLFLDPEYLGKVNFWSFFLVGFSFGGFLMSWNLTTYLLSSQYFPFLASLSRPFTKFCVNNFVLPISVGIYYTYLLVSFMIDFQELPNQTIFYNYLGLLAGFFSLISLYALYFQFTNRDISYYEKRQKAPPNLGRKYSPGHRKVDIDYIKQDANRLPITTYLNERLQTRLVRSVAHYESSLLKNIFKQNHLNALVLQMMIILTLLVLGYMVDVPLFRIPAGSSILIFFSLITMFIGAVSYWFSKWRTLIILLSLIIVNYFTSFDIFNRQNQAYGLDYAKDNRAPYSYEALSTNCSFDSVAKDKASTIAILDRWQEKTKQEKPPMVILCVSGGGLRSASWTMQVMQKADSLLNGQLMDHTVLITGASGGMLGMAYLREVYLRYHQGENINPYDKIHLDRISQDLLNSLAFTIISNDLFLPWANFQFGDQKYSKDRGYVFEQHLNENTLGFLDKPLSAYRKPEQDALIPMIYLSPSIVNDGRRLLISPQDLSFMMISPIGLTRPDAVEVDAVDFRRIFYEQRADSLRFLSGLRMNATYPYILPNVHLPSNPEIEVVDAGFRDNYGILSATRFLQVFQDWIKENTSRVILMQISSSERIEAIQASDNQGLVSSLFSPLGLTQKLFEVQEFEHDNSLSFISDILGPDHFQVLRFIYYPKDEKRLRASVSFHITEQEKEDVLNAIYLPQNQETLSRLRQLLQED